MDDPILFAIFAFLTLMVVLSWAGYRVYYKPGRFLKQLGNPVITDGRNADVLAQSVEPQQSTIITVLTQIGSKVPSSEAEVASLKTNLIRAGFRSERALPVFYGVRITSVLVMRTP
jgi:tight adherence protein C